MIFANASEGQQADNVQRRRPQGRPVACQLAAAGRLGPLRREQMTCLRAQKGTAPVDGIPDVRDRRVDAQVPGTSFDYR